MIAPSERQHFIISLLISSFRHQPVRLKVDLSEALASGTPIIAHGNPYLDNVITDQMFESSIIMIMI